MELQLIWEHLSENMAQMCKTSKLEIKKRRENVQNAVQGLAS